jgi:hypothetical protein
MRSAAYDTTCHRDHMHFSLSWEGAMGRTSFWTRTVAAPDYGPCRPEDLNWASPYRSPRATPCPAYPHLQARRRARALQKTLVTYSGMTLRAGDTGPVVTAVQRAIGARVTGAFDAGTRTAVGRWRHRHHLPSGRRVDASVWRALVRPIALRPTRAG